LKAELSASEARRAALTAQGFNAMRRHEAVGAAQLCKGVDRLGLLQIDSVNILVRAQYLPLFSRLGSYELALLDALMAAVALYLNRRLAPYANPRFKCSKRCT
jgi:uncharacterized protein YcaQ